MHDVRWVDESVVSSEESTGIGEKEFAMKIKMGADFVGTTGWLKERKDFQFFLSPWKERGNFISLDFIVL